MTTDETGWWWNRKSDQVSPVEIPMLIQQAIEATRRLYLDEHMRKSDSKPIPGYSEALYSTCMSLMEALEFAHDVVKLQQEAEFICLVDFDKKHRGEEATAHCMSPAEIDRVKAIKEKRGGQ